MGPIRPEEIVGAKIATIPEEVFKVFNMQIAQNFEAGSAKIDQDVVVSALTDELGCSRKEIFDNGWLNVEEIYQEAGWIVEYHKPDWDEQYSPYFIFRATRRKG